MRSDRGETQSVISSTEVPEGELTDWACADQESSMTYTCSILGMEARISRSLATWSPSSAMTMRASESLMMNSMSPGTDVG